MTDDSEGGAMRELEQARLYAAARAAREAAEIPPEQPLSRREPSGSLPPPTPAATASRKLIREVLFSGTVVETNVTPPPPQPPRRDHEYRPRIRRANPTDYHRTGRRT